MVAVWCSNFFLATLVAPCCLPAAVSAHEGAALRGSSWHNRRLHHNVEARNAATHFSYTSPLQYGHPVAWYNNLVPRHSSESTFFATNTQGFGYMGLQQVEERGLFFQGTAIFSIWDNGCNDIMDPSACPLQQQAEIIECGELAVCSRFGNEGTGFRSMLRFDEWELEQSYGFLVQAIQISTDKVRYDGYFHAPELGGWVLISKIQVSVGSKPWYLHSMGSFVEQWDTRSSEDVRWGRFGPGFVEAAGAQDVWTQITRATFSHTVGAAEDTTHVHANVTNYGTQWGMGIGGDLVKGVVQNTVFDVYQYSGVPQDLLHFSTLRQSGQLPTGCLGGTCTGTLVKHVIQEAFSKTFILLTALGLVACLCICCTTLCWWRQRRGLPAIPSALQRRQAPPASVSQPAPAGQAADLVDALSAAVEAVAEAAGAKASLSRASSPAAPRVPSCSPSPLGRPPRAASPALLTPGAAVGRKERRNISPGPSLRQMAAVAAGDMPFAQGGAALQRGRH